MNSYPTALKMRLAWALAILVPACAQTMADTAKTGTTHYHITGHIAGPDGLWDYASVDQRARRLYVARQGGIMAIDLQTGKVTPYLFRSPVIHLPLPIGNGRLLATTGTSNTAVILNGITGEVLATIPTGADPDSAAYDRGTGLAITFNRGSTNTTIINISKATVVGGFKLPGEAEFSIADGRGTVYVNLTTLAAIAVIDLASEKIVRTIPMPGCEEPTGLAFDAADKLLISACTNGIAEIMSATDGHEIRRIKIGTHPDAAMFDPVRRLAFIPSAGNGTLSIISIKDPDHIEPVQTMTTKRGIRTGAVDLDTGKVYLPAAKLIPPKSPGHWPSVAHGTFEILVATP